MNSFWNSGFWYFVVAITSGLAGFIASINVLRRNRIDASASVMTGALELVEQLRTEVMRFREEVSRLAGENDDLHGQVRRLSDENDALRSQLRRLEDRVYAAAGAALPELAHVLETRAGKSKVSVTHEVTP